jgi:hypothetical protein
MATVRPTPRTDQISPAPAAKARPDVTTVALNLSSPTRVEPSASASSGERDADILRATELQDSLQTALFAITALLEPTERR